MKFTLHLLIKVENLIWRYLLVDFRVSGVINTCNTNGFFNLVDFLWFDGWFWVKVIYLVVNRKVPFNKIFIWSFTEWKLQLILVNLIHNFLVLVHFFWRVYFLDIFRCRDLTWLLFAHIRDSVTVLTLRLKFIRIFITILLKLFDARHSFYIHFILSGLHLFLKLLVVF